MKITLAPHEWRKLLAEKINQSILLNDVPLEQYTINRDFDDNVQVCIMPAPIVKPDDADIDLEDEDG